MNVSLLSETGGIDRQGIIRGAQILHELGSHAKDG